MFRFILCALTFVFTACAEPHADSVDMADQQLSLGAPSRTLERGVLAFGAPLAVNLSRTVSRQLFHFSLAASAQLVLRTLAAPGNTQVDTLLSLYREGAKHPLARNDDDGPSRFSRIERELPAGAYVLSVEGFKRSSTGDFVLTASCDGAGCPLPPPPACLFGDTFFELRAEPVLTILNEHWITSVDQLTSALEGEQLVIALQQSSHTDVSTPLQALAAADQGEVRRMTLRDEASGREYDVFEYGAGDNSYGAIFRQASLEKAASIHDGDLLECTEHALSLAPYPMPPSPKSTSMRYLSATRVPGLGSVWTVVATVMRGVGAGLIPEKSYGTTAIASISTLAPRGKAATWTVARAGG